MTGMLQMFGHLWLTLSFLLVLLLWTQWRLQETVSWSSRPIASQTGPARSFLFLDTNYQSIREEAPSIATTDTDDLASLADEGQDLLRAAEQFAEDEDYVSTASLISDSTLELPISLVAPEEEEEEEEEDWVWEGLSQWSIELSIPQ